MNSIAIIPARGGSKRIPRKNIKDFNGKPIIAYAIDTAINSGIFDEIMVSTDDKEIAEIAVRYGATVPFLRSEKNSNDYATTFDVIEEVISNYKKRDMHFDLGCCIYPSTPLITVQLLTSFYGHFCRNEYDCLFPVLRYGYPIQRALVTDEQERMKMLHPEHIVTRSQDLQTTYHDAGQFYFFNIEKLIKAQNLWTANTGILEIDQFHAQDIDNMEDWRLAELKYQLLHKTI